MYADSFRCIRYVFHFFEDKLTPLFAFLPLLFEVNQLHKYLFLCFLHASYKDAISNRGK